MSFANTRKAITDVLKTYSGAPNIFAENQNVPDSAQSAAWVRWSIRFASSQDSEVGGKRERHLGTLYFQHFELEGEGTLAAVTFADKIATLLNQKRISGGSGTNVRFKRAVPAFIGKVGGFTQHNITIDFWSDTPAVNAA